MIITSYLSDKDWLEICKHRLNGYTWIMTDVYLYITTCGTNRINASSFLYKDIYPPILGYETSRIQYDGADIIVFGKAIELYNIKVLTIEYNSVEITNKEIRTAIFSDNHMLNIRNDRVVHDTVNNTFKFIYDDLHDLVSILRYIIDKVYRHGIGDGYKDILYQALDYAISLIPVPEDECRKWQRLQSEKG